MKPTIGSVTWLGVRVELLFSGEQSNRVREKLGHNVSFADGYPMLIISQASLDELNRRSPETHSMDQFRTNFVVSNTEPLLKIAGNVSELVRLSSKR